MSQVAVLDARVKPTAENLSTWNKALPGERLVDYEYEDPATNTTRRIKLPYWVKFAITVRYVHPGFNLPDYLWGAINGFKSDENDIVRAGFNLVAVANEMGLGKSSLSLQLEGQVYGEKHAGEWYPDWDLVLKYKILNREEIIPMWKQAKELGRIKCLLLDDIDSIFSKELWFEDRPLYIKLRKAINLIRPRVANFIVTAPSLNDVISILNTKITFEVMPFPNQTYMVERYCRFVDQFSSNTNFFRKILTEYSRFHLKDLPSDVYNQYDAARAVKEEEEMDALQEAMEDSATKRKEKEDKIITPKEVRTICICPSCGYKWTLRGSQPNRCPKCRTILKV